MKKKYDITLEYVIHKTVTLELDEKEANDISVGSYPDFPVPYIEDAEEIIISNIEKAEGE